MRTKFVMTAALAALLTGGGAACAVAQSATVTPAEVTCRAPAPNESGYGSRKLSLQECRQQQQASSADSGLAGTNGNNDVPSSAPNAGPSAHDHPYGYRYP